jgi:hypothetical protein
MKRFFKNEIGQTSMEYMLLLLVAASIGFSFKKKMEEFLVSNPNSLITKHINDLTTLFESDPKYRTFSILRF